MRERYILLDRVAVVFGRIVECRSHLMTGSVLDVSCLENYFGYKVGRGVTIG